VFYMIVSCANVRQA